MAQALTLLSVPAFQKKLLSWLVLVNPGIPVAVVGRLFGSGTADCLMCVPYLSAALSTPVS